MFVDCDLLAGILRGQVEAWPEDAPDPTEAVRLAEWHGVAPLLWCAIEKRAGPWPAEFVAGLAASARAEAALELARQRELQRVVERLNTGGLRALVIKGAHLAFAVYEMPHLRPRLDTDLLIDEATCDTVRSALERLGYTLVPHVTGTLVMPQFHLRREEPSGMVHQLDVHWRLAVPQAFGSLPSVDELWRSSTPIAELGPAARGPSLVDALVIACAHRAAHHSGGSALKWIVDVARIVERLSDNESAMFVEAASRARVRSIATQTLTVARDLLGARLTGALAELADAPLDTTESTAAYLQPVGRAKNLALDLRALEGLGPKIRLLREHLLPSPVYMRAAYAPDSRWPLPALYVRRAVAGAARWLTTDRRGTRV